LTNASVVNVDLRILVAFSPLMENAGEANVAHGLVDRISHAFAVFAGEANAAHS